MVSKWGNKNPSVQQAKLQTQIDQGKNNRTLIGYCSGKPINSLRQLGHLNQKKQAKQQGKLQDTRSLKKVAKKLLQ